MGFGGSRKHFLNEICSVVFMQLGEDINPREAI